MIYTASSDYSNNETVTYTTQGVDNNVYLPGSENGHDVFVTLNYAEGSCSQDFIKAGGSSHYLLAFVDFFLSAVSQHRARLFLFVIISKGPGPI